MQEISDEVHRIWWMLFLRDVFRERAWCEYLLRASTNVTVVRLSLVCEQGRQHQRQFLLTTITWEKCMGAPRRLPPPRRKKKKTLPSGYFV